MAYDRKFFTTETENAQYSAELIAGVCVELVAPTSVVDIGCGIGIWLAAFRNTGVQTIAGFDGDYVDRDLLEIPPESFQPFDLEKRLPHDRRYDLAVCLEVAEHLAPHRGPSLVEDLTALAPAVLFSAAVPFQGGTDHRNEQWQDYWADLFANRGFQACDCIRPRVWDDPKILPWYAQNAILYHDSSVQIAYKNSLPLRLIHPNFWVRQATATIPLSDLVRATYPSGSKAILFQLRKLKHRLAARRQG